VRTGACARTHTHIQTCLHTCMHTNPNKTTLHKRALPSHQGKLLSTEADTPSIHKHLHTPLKALNIRARIPSSLPTLNCKIKGRVTTTYSRVHIYALDAEQVCHTAVVPCAAMCRVRMCLSQMLPVPCANARAPCCPCAAPHANQITHPDPISKKEVSMC